MSRGPRARPPAAGDESLTAVILCSGRGLRMSSDGLGVDKGLVEFRGKPLVEHVIDRIHSQVSEILLNAPDRPEWERRPYRRIPDRIPDQPGPLAGLHAGMLAANTPWLLCVPCDTPFLPTDLVSRLSACLQASRAACAIAVAGGRAHPSVNLIDVSLASDLQAWIEAGGRRMGEWLSSIGALGCDFPDPAAFSNLNTPDDLQRLAAS